MLSNRIEKRPRLIGPLAVASCLAASAIVSLIGPAVVGAVDGAQTPNPTIKPATVATEAADFALEVAAPGAFCDGSGAEGWRVQTFIVDDDADLSALTFTGSFPVGVVGDDRDASDGSIESPLQDGVEAIKDINPAASPKGLINPSALSGIDFGDDGWNLVDGDYQIGFACVLNNVLKQWWATTVAVDVDGSTFLRLAESTAATTSVAVTASPETAKVGDTVTFTATATPTAAAGTLELFVDGVSKGAKPASAGAAAWPIDDLTAGTKSITAKFTPTDVAAYKSSTSPVVSYVVAATAKTTSVVLTAFPESKATEGASVTLTATVTPPAAVGKVTFKDGTTNLGTAVDVISGKATFSTTALPVGARSLTADFVPTDANKFTSSTGTLSYVVEASGAKDVEVTISADPADRAPVGQDVEFTAKIDPMVAGEVEFFRAVTAEGAGGATTTTSAPSTTTTTISASSASLFGEADAAVSDLDADELESLADPIAVADGQAVLTMKDLEPGEHEIYAVFTPEDTEAYKVSTSEALLFTVEGAGSSTTLVPGAQDPTTSPTVFPSVSGSGASGGGSLPVTGVGLVLAVGGFALLYVGRVLYLLGRPAEESTPS